MANYKELTNKATNIIKVGAGKIEGILVSSAGSAWTIQVFDSADAATPANPIFGATAVTVPAAGTFINFGINGCHFSNGLTVVTAGTTAGELTVFYV